MGSDQGSAGASARREFERRRQAREHAVHARHPRIGGVLLAVNSAPAHETSWARGAVGEELVAAAIARKCPEVLALHDRGMPGSRANIDHLVIAASGVWVIDAKRYDGKIEVAKKPFGEPQLKIGGRRRPKLVTGLEQQVVLVRSLVPERVPVRGAFCFVDGDLPLFGTPTIRDLPLYHRRSLCRALNRGGPLDAADRAVLLDLLAERLPAA